MGREGPQAVLEGSGVTGAAAQLEEACSSTEPSEHGLQPLGVLQARCRRAGAHHRGPNARRAQGNQSPALNRWGMCVCNSTSHHTLKAQRYLEVRAGNVSAACTVSFTPTKPRRGHSEQATSLFTEIFLPKTRFQVQRKMEG